MKTFICTTLLVAAIRAMYWGDVQHSSSGIHQNQGDAYLAAASGGGADFSTRDDKLKFRDGAGKTLFSLKIKDDGAKLLDGSDKELARIKLEKRPDGPEYKIKSPDEKTIGYLTGAPAKWKLKDADKHLLFELRQEADGGYKVSDAADILVYLIKPKADQIEVEDDQKTKLLTVGSVARKTIVTDGSGKIVLSLSDPTTPLAMTFLALEKFTRPQASAIFVALSRK